MDGGFCKRQEMKANYAQRHNDRKEEIREALEYAIVIGQISVLKCPRWYENVIISSGKTKEAKNKNPYLKEMFPEI